ncbi:MAG: ester cyclase [Chloroflexota bacterium]|nr:ester cyclase [Chloroflexota bacterium]
MSTEQNKQIADRLPAEISKGNLAVFDEVVDPKAVDHALPPGMPPTVESTKQFFAAFRAAFPDLKYKVEDTITEGDYVVQRTTGTATMKGAFQGMPPSGKSATWSEIHIVRFANGKVVEHWANVDQMGMLTQLGFGPK